ncbi:MAG: type ISP restriction/modification enzyme, partial [Bdellovibrionales bacterium]
MSLGDKKDKNTEVIFDIYSLGVSTNRDAWVYNYSKKALYSNTRRMINFYNSQVTEYKALYENISKNNRPEIEKFIDTDPQKISWTSYLKNYLERCLQTEYNPQSLSKSLYRPFSKQWLYFNNDLNDRRGQMPVIFPDSTVNNRVICVTGRGATKEFCAFITDSLPDYETISKSQCFPLKLYEPTQADENQHPSGVKPQADLFSDEAHVGWVSASVTQQNATNIDTETLGYASANPAYQIKDGITDAGLAHFQAAYPFETINKEDLFYYIYGLLHSEGYLTR